MKNLVHFFISAFAIGVTAYFMSSVTISDWQTLLIVTIGLALVNTLIKPILTLVTLPITLLTFGLFTFVINALMVLLVSHFVPAFHVADFWSALIFSILLSIISAVFHKIAE